MLTTRQHSTPGLATKTRVKNNAEAMFGTLVFFFSATVFYLKTDLLLFYVYILYSPSTQSFYKGSTADVLARLNRHNSGYEKYTSKGVHWILLWSTQKEAKAQAMILERKLKHLTVKRTLEFMLKYKEGIPGSDELELILKLSEC